MRGILPLLAAALLASGCATMFNRSPGDVSVITTPEGADVKVDELETSCQTPCELEVKPDRYELHVSKAGYKPETIQLVRRMATSFWINFVTGPYAVIGMGIDWLTDSIFKISPAEIRLKLVPLAGTKIEEKKKPEDDEDDEDDEGSGDDGAAGPPPPKSGPAAAPPLEGDKIAPVAPAAEAAPPPVPAAKVEAPFPEPAPDAYIDRQVSNYYGDLPSKKRAAVRAHLDAILKELQANGERPDVDEAVRIEKFRYP